MTSPPCSAQMVKHHSAIDNPRLWGAVEVGSGEVEMVEFLYALVRLQKPKHCLELGTGSGVTARAIGEALSDNGRGELITVDIDPEMVELARARTEGLPVCCLLGDSREVKAPTSMDLLFVDSGEPHERLADVLRFKDAAVGIVVVHDTGLYPTLGDALKRLPGFSSLRIKTPLGLTLGEWAR